MEKHLKRIWDDDATDNSRYHYCDQCKDCIYRDDDPPLDIAYKRIVCKKYNGIHMKPREVWQNEGDCPHRKTKEEAGNGGKV